MFEIVVVKEEGQFSAGVINSDSIPRVGESLTLGDKIVRVIDILRLVTQTAENTISMKISVFCCAIGRLDENNGDRIT